MRSWLAVLVLGVGVQAARASAPGPFPQPDLPPELVLVLEGEGLRTDTVSGKDPERAVAAVLAVLVGPFGAHRLYFGTKPKVPIIYGVTFGGFGVLVLIDLGHILFTKDLTPYRDNDRVFMWAKPRTASTPP
ncbi:MAG: TM2 domain-containing protein [Flavobacteriales bacterium]|nr:TM2 domain-containing protein [Flavobacteriales bacterium]